MIWLFPESAKRRTKTPDPQKPLSNEFWRHVYADGTPGPLHRGDKPTCCKAVPA